MLRLICKLICRLKKSSSHFRPLRNNNKTISNAKFDEKLMTRVSPKFYQKRVFIRNRIFVSTDKYFLGVVDRSNTN